MTDTPTVVEVTTSAPPPSPQSAPAGAPGRELGSSMPGMPLAVAAANAAAAIASGAVIAGPLALAAAGVAAGAAAGAAALRRRTGRARTHQGGRAANASRLARSAARHAMPGSAYSPAAAGRRSGAPHVPGQQTRTGRSGTAAGVPARSTTAFGQTFTIPPRPSHRPTVHSPNQAPAHGGSGYRGHQRKAGSVASGRSGWVGRSLDGARPSGSGRPWSGGSAKVQARQERRATRTDGRLAKGLARAQRRAGITPATSAKNAATETAPRTPDGLSAEQRKRLKRSTGRFRARMVAAGLATGLVGAVSVAAGNWRHKGKVSSHVRRTWARLSSRARTVRDARNAKILATATDQNSTPGAVPVPGESVNVPGRTATSAPAREPVGTAASRVLARITLGKPTTIKETAMSDSESTVPAFSLSSAADVMLQAASTFDPEHMTEFSALADDLPVAFATLQEVLRVLTEKGAEQLPLHFLVAEQIGKGYQAMGNVVEELEHVASVFRIAHADDLERNENPRNGLDAERKWNV
ncbi:hypothetical protein [Kitasatospora sp. NPDC002040]|uniref:hypothetical protein n=1 Tax=Kitasatospora sp. NPDC002040 TaxID=3154661 RepID=UPI0033233D99